MSVVLTTGAQAQPVSPSTPMTAAEIKAYSDRIDRYYTESPSQAKLAEINAGLKAGDIAVYCRINLENIDWYRKARSEAFAAITALRAQGKSTDPIHHAYLSLSERIGASVITDADTCVEKRVEEGPDGLGGVRAEIKLLTDALSAARKDALAAQARGDDLNACADIRSAEQMSAERLSTYETLEQVYSLMLPEAWAPFKTGYATAKTEAAELKALSAATCARVNAPEPPPLPSVPQTPVEVAASAYTNRLLKATSTLLTFTMGDAAGMCEAAKNGARLTDEAEAGLKADIARLQAEGQDVEPLRKLLGSAAEMRQKAAETKTRACEVSADDAKGAALMAEADGLMAEHEKAMADLKAAGQARDRVAGCKASQRSLKSLERLREIMHESVALDGENLSAADKAVLEADLTQLNALITQMRDLSSDLCPTTGPAKPKG
ncbi:MAG: hypothetical protein QM667_00150 [Asticcacaulis sp.]